MPSMCLRLNLLRFLDASEDGFLEILLYHGLKRYKSIWGMEA